MCGPLALNFTGNTRLSVTYHLGRTISYTTLGALAGAFGHKILGTSSLPWLPELSLAFISLTLILTGLRAIRGKGMHFQLPSSVQNLLNKGWRHLALSKLPRECNAGIAGALTVFLPCGHLYSFAAGAIATGSAWGGAIFMLAFCIGTLPALAIGTGMIRKIFQPGFKFAPRLAGSLLLMGGLISIGAFTMRLQESTSVSAHDHAHSHSKPQVVEQQDPPEMDHNHQKMNHDHD
jgi:sulfite exporter TauE/SafE